MPSFNETLERMKNLITYGNELNESKNLKTHTLEHRALAADGITYGIIKENSKYYIKSAPKGKETIAEAYDYLGGFCNKANYEYTSYANALKQFELKMASINEAHDQKVNIESLNPFADYGSIVRGDRFVGRKKELNTIKQRVLGPNYGNLAIMGLPRIGKSSLAWEGILERKGEGTLQIMKEDMVDTFIDDMAHLDLEAEQKKVLHSAVRR